MSRKIRITIDLDLPVLEWLEKYATQQGISRNQAVAEAIEALKKEAERTVKVVETIERREDYPVRDEAYLVGRAEDGRYFFAWGPTYPYADEIPGYDIPDGESGISFHATADEALDAMQAAVEAVEVLRG